MFPSFLCIGTQKGGTTWLYDNIKDHPQVWLAPIKEIFYFDGHRPSRRPLLWQLCEPSNRDLRRHVLRGIKRRLKPAAPESGGVEGVPIRPRAATAPAAPKQSKLQRARWHMRFMFLPRNDAWYSSLFQPGPGQIAGDINPYLALMDHARVAHVGSLMPDARIIFLIRNPVDRLWSQLGMVMRDRNITDFQGLDHDLLEQQLTEAARLWPPYLTSLETWTSVYPEERVFVGFFDQLREDPRGLLRTILDFIGIDSSDTCIPDTVDQKSNPSGGPRITDYYRELLSRLFMTHLEELHDHFQNRHTARWLEGARQAISA